MPPDERTDHAALIAAAKEKIRLQKREIQRLRALNKELSLRMGEVAMRLNRSLAELGRHRSRRGADHNEIVRDLVIAAEYRDHDTGAHLVRIGYFAACLAPLCGCDAAFTRQLLVASPMHDVGKIGIPDHILKKRGTLDPDERRVMEHHAEYGARILADSQSPLMRLAAEIAHTHHEHYDGGGYPRGLQGTEIPLAGRIVAVIDVFDALAMDRTYRRAMDVEQALGIIRDGRGSQFDPGVVDAFFSVIDDLLEIRERINSGARPESFAELADVTQDNPLAFYDSPLQSVVQPMGDASAAPSQ